MHPRYGSNEHVHKNRFPFEEILLEKFQVFQVYKIFCNSTITLKGINTKGTKEIITGKQNNVKTLLNNKI